MEWSEVLADPSLQDLPYKIETNRYGQIVMSPASRRHSRRQSRIERLLDELLSGGEAFGECPIATTAGTKVADVVWVSAALLARQENIDPLEEAPEVCVEVLSASNSQHEIDEKRALYFEKGAIEVWICDLAGDMQFFGRTGRIEHSVFVPEFPQHVPLSGSDR
jgi:Uma2 family endonuclease